ncbi:hypothetical protein G9A89_009642 [Geosiphon pyriformis]|nr:hypothetical protein G9A89_009642 [Geosiphon pyriformis]
MPEGSDFQQTALSEGEVAVSRSNSSNNTILPAQIVQNTNLSDIFSFEFEANKSPFLLNNAVVNEQKAITTMYTEAEKENMKLAPATFAKHVIENDLDIPKEVKNGTTLLALHVEIYYQKNTTGLILQ